jgi:hypothetical protein
MHARCAAVALLVLALVPAAAGRAFAADPPFKITSADGKSSLSVGFLVQPQLEIQTTADGTGTAQNLFLRRVRLIFGGKATDKLSFFIDTDSPNLGKDSSSGQKIAENVFLQDVIVTWTFADELQIDAGMLLFPLSHNTGQSAASLLAIDYSPYSFLASDPTGSRGGRDYGVQARGYVWANHIEYRLGVLQGHADPNATAPFRYQARAVWYPFEAETGFFYGGTNLGARRILALGAGFDHQEHYSAGAVDAYLDQPLKGGNALTLQADYVHYDGGQTFTQLPEQDTWMAEAGLYHKRSRLGPWAQVSGRHFATSAPSESKWLIGAAYWVYGHRFNLKAGAGQLARTGSPTRTQVVVQGQFFWF